MGVLDVRPVHDHRGPRGHVDPVPVTLSRGRGSAGEEDRRGRGSEGGDRAHVGDVQAAILQCDGGAGLDHQVTGGGVADLEVVEEVDLDPGLDRQGRLGRPVHVVLLPDAVPEVRRLVAGAERPHRDVVLGDVSRVDLDDIDGVARDAAAAVEQVQPVEGHRCGEAAGASGDRVAGEARRVVPADRR